MMNTNKKWTRDEVLAEARRRVNAMVVQTPNSIQRVLESLVAEAGWEDSELLNALCTDVVKRSSRPPPRVSGTMAKVVIPRDQVQKKAASGRGK